MRSVKTYAEMSIEELEYEIKLHEAAITQATDAIKIIKEHIRRRG